MPTHVSQSVRELKELGRNLYAAMRSMNEWGDSTPVPSRYTDAKKCYT